MPPRAPSAETLTDPGSIAAAVAEFIATHPAATLLEDGKAIFDLRTARHELSTEHGRCTMHCWSEQHNLVRTIVAATPRRDRLRLATTRFGHTQTKLLDLVASHERRTSTTREKNRQQFLPLLQRVLTREFADWKPEAFRTAMDLERSFGPAYARGMQVRGNQAWAVIAVNDEESATTIDGILTLGILWLHHCRQQSDGKRLFQGLRVIVPRGTAMITAARMAWLNKDAAAWELYELEAATETLTERDLADTGNVRTRLLHHPDEAAARERFAPAIEQVMRLVPASEAHRVDQHLRSTAELSFQLHGLEFARARISLAPRSFTHTLEVTVGSGREETALTETNHVELARRVAELFARRRAMPAGNTWRTAAQKDRIGAPQAEAAHSRFTSLSRKLAARHTSGRDPLYRAAPERWLESVLRRDLAPLTRALAAQPKLVQRTRRPMDANDDDNFGNRIDDVDSVAASSQSEARIIPRFDPRFVYAQVPAIAGASDRGMLDLLGITADGRLAVIELKADEDLQFALQGLDYWLRVRQHHLASAESSAGLGEFQRHGYFVGAVLSPSAPRLYLVAPALRIHPATETVLRYLSPAVEWQLLALDERWREQIRVVWRKSSKVHARA